MRRMEAASSSTMAAPTLSDWLDELQVQHPVGIDLGLDRVAQVAARLDLLEACPTTLTVAGTNGKGSVVEVVSTLLVGTGRSVGSYTSPHLLRFNERIRVNGHEASDIGIVEAFEAIECVRGDITLTYFEVATLAALWIFRDRDVDVQVLEVGLGGRLDAVNIIDADLAVVTSIGLDHTDWLGNDREQIAVEKAGVARPGRPCVIAEGDPPASLRARLDEIGAKSFWVGSDWFVSDSHVTLSSGQDLLLPPFSGLLPANVGAAIEALYQSGLITVDQLLTCGVQALSLAGRLNRQRRGQLDVVMDVAHNVESVTVLIDYLRMHPIPGKTTAMFGVMGDKPIHDMIVACAGVFDEWHLIDLSHIDRAMAVDAMEDALGGELVLRQGRLEALWPAVRDGSSHGDRVVIFGSFFTVGEALALFEAEDTEGDGGQ